MRVARSSIWILTFWLALASVAHADEIESHRTGPYVGVLFGAALPNFDGEFLFTPPPFEANTEEQASLAISARAGVRVHKNVAIEGQYEWVREWDIDTKTSRCAKASAQVFTGNVKLFAPFDAVHPYVLGGVGAGRYKSRVRAVNFGFGNSCTPTAQHGFESDHWELNLRAGGGFEVYLTRSVVLNLEASAIFSERRLLGEKFPYVGIAGGLQYRF